MLSPLVLVACAALAGPAAASPPPSRWISVSVATLWTEPGIARGVDAPSLERPGASARVGRGHERRAEALAGRQARDAGALRHEGVPARHVGLVVEDRRARPADAAQLPGLPRMGPHDAAHRRRTAEHLVRRRGETAHGVAVDLAGVDEQGDAALVRHPAARRVVDRRRRGGRSSGRPSRLPAAFGGRRPAQGEQPVAGADGRQARRGGEAVPRPGLPVGRHVGVRRRLLGPHLLRVPGPRQDAAARRRRAVPQGRQDRRALVAAARRSGLLPQLLRRRSTTSACTWATAR